MATVESVLLGVHIAAGFVALAAGAVALLATKGGRRHRLGGRLYVGAMAVVVGTVVPLLAVAPSQFRVFLTLVAVFSGYFVFSGYRALPRAGGSRRLDAAVAALTLCACLALGGWGIARLFRGDGFGAVLTVFGALGIAVAGADLRALRRRESEMWLVSHLSRMIGGYIATVSAVSAVNLTVLPPVVRWLWPTALGVPLILYWQAVHGDTGPLAGRV